MAYLSIGEMAKRLGIPASTLRYYDDEGLLPFVKRDASGKRIFEEQHYEWLQVISCLKKTGMPLKDIRRFIEMSMAGDETIADRLAMIQAQKEAVENQLHELTETLDTLRFKCWYYETAQAEGTTAHLRELPLEMLPAEFQPIRRRLRGE